MRNIDHFNLCVAQVLGECFESFPVRIDFEFEALGQKVFDDYVAGSAGDSPYDPAEYSRYAAATIDWLADAGYIWVGRKINSEVLAVTLTPKSLELLSAMPESLKENASVGSVLASETKTLGREGVLELVRVVLAAGAKYAFSGNI